MVTGFTLIKSGEELYSASGFDSVRSAQKWLQGGDVILAFVKIPEMDTDEGSTAMDAISALMCTDTFDNCINAIVSAAFEAGMKSK
jgi:hypothetical protein